MLKFNRNATSDAEGAKISHAADSWNDAKWMQDEIEVTCTAATILTVGARNVEFRNGGVREMFRITVGFDYKGEPRKLTLTAWGGNADDAGSIPSRTASDFAYFAEQHDTGYLAEKITLTGKNGKAMDYFPRATGFDVLMTLYTKSKDGQYINYAGFFYSPDKRSPLEVVTGTHTHQYEKDLDTARRMYAKYQKENSVTPYDSGVQVGYWPEQQNMTASPSDEDIPF